MQRIGEALVVLLLAAYVSGAPAFQPWRPEAVAAPLASWHNDVNRTTIAAAGEVKRAGFALGAVINEFVLSSTFLGRAGA